MMAMVAWSTCKYNTHIERAHWVAFPSRDQNGHHNISHLLQRNIVSTVFKMDAYWYSLEAMGRSEELHPSYRWGWGWWQEETHRIYWFVCTTWDMLFALEMVPWDVWRLIKDLSLLAETPGSLVFNLCESGWLWMVEISGIEKYFDKQKFTPVPVVIWQRMHLHPLYHNPARGSVDYQHRVEVSSYSHTSMTLIIHPFPLNTIISSLLPATAIPSLFMLSSTLSQTMQVDVWDRYGCQCP